MGTVYPVGSLYFGTQSTCPLAAIIDGSTWEKVGSSLITSVNTSVPVKGNGNTLGLTNGKEEGAIGNIHGASTQGNAGLIGMPVGKQPGAQIWHSNGGFGVVTDPEKSGIVGTVTRTALTVNIWKRTA